MGPTSSFPDWMMSGCANDGNFSARASEFIKQRRLDLAANEEEATLAEYE